MHTLTSKRGTPDSTPAVGNMEYGTFGAYAGEHKSQRPQALLRSEHAAVQQTTAMGRGHTTRARGTDSEDAARGAR